MGAPSRFDAGLPGFARSLKIPVAVEAHSRQSEQLGNWVDTPKVFGSSASICREKVETSSVETR
jgi:hypothetical protein